MRVLLLGIHFCNKNVELENILRAKDGFVLAGG